MTKLGSRSYLPAHDREYSNLKVLIRSALNSRSRRLFNDRVGMAAGWYVKSDPAAKRPT
ncbi:MAG: hypothetical protein JOY85_16220 [Acidobacteriaceae bacterium]|nr:hypothetical protein [Acidobacteriaceae bacterium]